jgi:hypothetical protein
MEITSQRNFVIALRAVHTRLKTLASQAKATGILEGNLIACANDIAHAAEDLERALQRLDPGQGKTTQ